MNVDALSSTSARSLTNIDPNLLGKEDFMQLLVTQLQNQDPLNPMSNDDFIAQLTQFSTLEQLQNLNDVTVDNAAVARVAQGASAVGMTAQFTDPDSGETLSGVVTSARMSDDGVFLSVGDHLVPVAEVQSLSSTPAQTESATSQQ